MLRQMGGGRDDDVKVRVRQGSPIKLDGGTLRVRFSGNPGQRRECVELVVLIFDRLRIETAAPPARPSRLKPAGARWNGMPSLAHGFWVSIHVAANLSLRGGVAAG
jgi:hypothetical protein